MSIEAAAAAQASLRSEFARGGRRAYALIKKEFDSAGMKFAFPTVQVAGGAEPPVAAAARQVLDVRGAAQSR